MWCWIMTEQYKNPGGHGLKKILGRGGPGRVNILHFNSDLWKSQNLFKKLRKYNFTI